MILQTPQHLIMAMSGADTLPFSYRNPFDMIEVSGRTCYKSEPAGNPVIFVEKLAKSGHHSVFEHAFFTLKIPIGRRSLFSFFNNNPFSSVYSTESILSSETDFFVGTNYRVLRDASLLALTANLASNEDILFLKKHQAYGCLAATVKMVTNRGVTHEIVRNRNSFSQESTRYCNYAKDKFGGSITVIPPKELFDYSCQETPLIDLLCDIADRELGVCLSQLTDQQLWEAATGLSEAVYLEFIRRGIKPQISRGVLTNDLKTEIIMTASWERWRWFFFQRTAKDAHPHMRQLATPLYKDFCKLDPSFAGLDIVEDCNSYY